MRVLYDHQTFSLQDFGGVSRIFTELISTSEEYGIEAELSALFSNNAYLNQLTPKTISPFLKNSHWKYKSALMYAINRIYSARILKLGAFDIFHPTYYDPYFLEYINSKPFVVTYHDIIHEKFANRYQALSRDKLIIEGKKVLVSKAHKIIAVSESTKRDLMEHYSVDEDKIEVVYLATTFDQMLKPKNCGNSSNDYVLFVGQRSLYKNFNFFLASIAQLLKDKPRLKLICAGGGNFLTEEVSIINELKLTEKVEYRDIDNDVMLQELYSNAACFIFPSLYEGFGIPLLEAFASGCPTAASETSSLPEIGGDAVVYFDPKDAKSIEEATARLLEDTELRELKVLNGYRRLSIFSWEVTKNKTYNIYRSMI
jgi:glycosyltransferase involved in cell wall biosynthesis